MASIQPLEGSRIYPCPQWPDTLQKNKETANLQNHERQEQVAAGVGGAAGLSQTTKWASKRAMKAENAYNTAARTIQQTARTVNDSTKTATDLWSKFKTDCKTISAQITKYFEKFKKIPIVGKILNNRATRTAGSALGGALAFFVLVTGVNKAVKTGAIAIDDFKQQYQELKSIV